MPKIGTKIKLKIKFTIITSKEISPISLVFFAIYKPEIIGINNPFKIVPRIIGVNKTEACKYEGGKTKAKKNSLNKIKKEAQKNEKMRNLFWMLWIKLTV